MPKKNAAPKSLPDWKRRICVDPKMPDGKPCIKGTMVRVSFILDYLMAGKSAEAIQRRLPALSAQDIRAAIAYAAWLSHQEEDRPCLCYRRRLLCNACR